MATSRAQRQSAEAEAATIARIAGNANGNAPPPQAPQPVPGEAAPPAAPAQAPGPAAGEAAPTPQEQAAAVGAPNTEATALAAPPIMYDVPFGEGDTRQLSPEQIAGTFNRYRDLNMQHQQLKPAIDLVQEALKANPTLSTQDVVDRIQQLANQQTQLGNQQPPQQQQPGQQPAGEAGPDPYKAWEDQNAANLPPGYREMGDMQKQLLENQRVQQQMMQQLMANMGGVADAAKATAGDARAQQIDAAKKTISNNLDRTAQQLNLGEADFPDFQVFFSERGYTLEDFVNSQVTERVMNDFVNARSSGEMQRLRDVNQRRTAFTGTLEPAASGEPAAPEDPSAQEDHIARMTKAAIAQRTGGV